MSLTVSARPVRTSCAETRTTRKPARSSRRFLRASARWRRASPWYAPSTSTTSFRAGAMKTASGASFVNCPASGRRRLPLPAARSRRRAQLWEGSAARRPQAEHGRGWAAPTRSRRRMRPRRSRACSQLISSLSATRKQQARRAMPVKRPRNRRAPARNAPAPFAATARGSSGQRCTGIWQRRQA